jgi:hypothetical protein
MFFRRTPLRLIVLSNLIPYQPQPRISSAIAFAPKSAPTSRPPSTSSTATMSLRFSRDPWNELHDGMQFYHDHFRHTFDRIYTLSAEVSSDASDAEELADLLSVAYDLHNHLNAHHSIEEYDSSCLSLTLGGTFFLC